jgi:type IV pilus assembly protein PilC
MKYRYTATSRDGKVENGKIEAPDASAAAEQIRRTGLLVVSLRKEGGGILEGLLAIGWVPNVIKVTFTKHLSLMIKAGLPVDEAIRVLRDQGDGRFKKVLSGVLRSVEQGQPLSDGFAEFPTVFSELFVSTIRAGEASGSLDKALDDLSLQLTKSFDLQRKIRGAMIYPILVLTAAGGIGVGLSFFVLPKILKLFESITVELPFATRMLLAFSNFLVQHGTVFFIGCIVGVIGLVNFLKLKPVKPFSHLVLLKIPVFGKLARDYNLAAFARTMSTLLKAGIVIGDAFLVTANTISNVRYKKALMRVKEGAESGVPASTVLEEFPKLFPLLSTRMLAVGERTGKLEDTFGYLAEFYEDEVDATTKNLSTILEPVLLIVIGLTVAYIAIAIISPIYNFIGNIQRL